PRQVHPLSLHDALPISHALRRLLPIGANEVRIDTRHGRSAHARPTWIRNSCSVLFSSCESSSNDSAERVVSSAPESESFTARTTDRKSTRLNSSHVKIS